MLGIRGGSEWCIRTNSGTFWPLPEPRYFIPPLHPAKRHEARRRTQPARPNTLSTSLINI